MADEETIAINKDFWLNAKEALSLQSINNALTTYYELLADALELGDDFAVILDTQVLLNYYVLPSKTQASFEKFIGSHANKIKITRQIELEFLRNRLRKIDEIFTRLNTLQNTYTHDLVEKGIDTVCNKFDNFLAQKILRFEYPELHEALTQVLNDLKQISNKLSNSDLTTSFNDSIESLKNKHNGIEIQDSFLQKLAKIPIIENLSNEEKDFLVEKYNELTANYDPKKSKAFPGGGDKKKEENSEGDFIIFHEIIKYMQINNCHAILLTQDTLCAIIR